MIILNPGDVITIRKDLGNMDDCESGLMNDMRKMAGRTMTIEEIYKLANEVYVRNDQTFYYLKEDFQKFLWSEDCFDIYVAQEDSDPIPDITELISEGIWKL